MEFRRGNTLKGTKVSRAAVLPFTILNKEILFLLAVHRQTGEITDLGGGVKKNECALSACLREFKEETNKIFGEFYDNYNNFSTDLAVIDRRDSMSVLFIPLTRHQSKRAIKMFNRYNNPPNTEILKLVWVREETFIKLISGTHRCKMWCRIRNFYNNMFSHYKISDHLLKSTRDSLLVKSMYSRSE